MRRFRTVTALAIVAVVALSAPAAWAQLTWSAWYDQYNSSTAYSARSVAYGNDSVYTGLIQPSGGRHVYRVDGGTPGLLLNDLFTGYNQPKGLVVDSRGNVFIACRDGAGSDGGNVLVSSPTLTAPVKFVLGDYEFGGVAAYSTGGNHYLYVSQEAGGIINRYDITDINNVFLDTAFGTAGTYTVAGGASCAVLRWTVPATYSLRTEMQTLCTESART